VLEGVMERQNVRRHSQEEFQYNKFLLPNYKDVLAKPYTKRLFNMVYIQLGRSTSWCI